MTTPLGNATVLNTTVLSNFAQVDRVELLLDLPRLVTVNEVQEELKRGTDEGVSAIDFTGMMTLRDQFPNEIQGHS